MFIGTHALLPVSLVLASETAALAGGRAERFPRWTALTVGICGALPDLCSPHLSLAARYSSWSHTLGFLGLLVPVLAVATLLFPAGLRLRVAVVAWLAAALHLATDALSGGIPWLLPWSDDILGGRWIPYDWWLPSEVGFLFLTLILLLGRQRLRRMETPGRFSS